MTERDKARLEKITKDLNKRMAYYHSSLEPTDDEVTIAWLLTLIYELQEKSQSERDSILDILMQTTPTTRSC